jgi:hypothetical protein
VTVVQSPQVPVDADEVVVVAAVVGFPQPVVVDWELVVVDELE